MRRCPSLNGAIRSAVPMDPPTPPPPPPQPMLLYVHSWPVATLVQIVSMFHIFVQTFGIFSDKEHLTPHSPPFCDRVQNIPCFKASPLIVQQIMPKYPISPIFEPDHAKHTLVILTTQRLDSPPLHVSYYDDKIDALHIA